MSNDKPSRKRKYPEIQPVRVTPQDRASTKRVMGRLMGKAPEEIAAPEKPSPPEEIAAPEKTVRQPLKISGAEEISPPVNFSHPEQHTRVPNELFELVLPTLKPSEQVVLLRLYRLTWGFQKETCQVSMGKLARACNLSSRQVTTCVQMLEKRVLIRRLRVDLDNVNQGERGVLFQMLIPRAASANISAAAKTSPPAKFSAPEEIADNKRKAFKGNNLKGVTQKVTRLTPEEIQSFTATVVDLLSEGKSVEEVEGAYAPSMHPADWAAVRSVALAQGATKKGK